MTEGSRPRIVAIIISLLFVFGPILSIILTLIQADLIYRELSYSISGLLLVLIIIASINESRKE